MFAIGEVAIIGTPADLGVSVSLAIREYALDKGFKYPFVASQCNGYVGYIHRKSDYETTAPKQSRAMAYYENVLAIFGRDIGEQFIQTAKKLIDDLSIE